MGLLSNPLSIQIQKMIEKAIEQHGRDIADINQRVAMVNATASNLAQGMAHHQSGLNVHGIQEAILDIVNEQLLVNGGLELDNDNDGVPDNWNKHVDTNLAAVFSGDFTLKKYGDKSLRIDFANTSGETKEAYISQVIESPKIMPDMIYSFSYFRYNQAVNKYQHLARIIIYDSLDNIINTYEHNPELHDTESAATREFARWTTSVGLPENASKVEFQIGVVVEDGGNGSVWLDYPMVNKGNVSLRPPEVIEGIIKTDHISTTGLDAKVLKAGEINTGLVDITSDTGNLKLRGDLLEVLEPDEQSILLKLGRYTSDKYGIVIFHNNAIVFEVDNYGNAYYAGRAHIRGGVLDETVTVGDGPNASLVESVRGAAAKAWEAQETAKDWARIYDKNQIVDNRTGTLFNFDRNLQSTNGVGPLAGYNVTLLTGEGKYGGGVYIGKGGGNLFTSADSPVQETQTLVKGDTYTLSAYGDGTASFRQKRVESAQADFEDGTLTDVSATAGGLVLSTGKKFGTRQKTYNWVSSLTPNWVSTDTYFNATFFSTTNSEPIITNSRIKFDDTDLLWVENTGRIQSTEGTIEYWVNVDSAFADDILNRNVYYKTNSADEFYKAVPLSNFIGTLSAGLHHFAVAWSADEMLFYVDGVKTGSVTYPFVPYSGFETFYVSECFMGTFGHVSFEIDDLAISLNKKTDYEIYQRFLWGRTIAFDEYTTCLFKFDDLKVFDGAVEIYASTSDGKLIRLERGKNVDFSGKRSITIIDALYSANEGVTPILTRVELDFVHTCKGGTEQGVLPDYIVFDAYQDSITFVPTNIEKWQLEKRGIATPYGATPGVLEYPATNILNPNTGTISMLVKKKVIGANDTEFYHLKDGTNRLYIRVLPDRFKFSVMNSDIEYPMVPELDTWYRLTLVWDNGTFYGYVNDVQVGSGTYDGVLDIGPTFKLMHNFSSSDWGSIIDELLILKYAATDKQVIAWHTVDKPLVDPDKVVKVPMVSQVLLEVV